jgi:hypothetical protein
VLDNHTVKLGAQDKDFALHVARREFDIKPRVTLVGKFLLLHQLALAVEKKFKLEKTV